MRRNLLHLLLFAAFFLVSCQPSPLAGTAWQLQSIELDDGTIIVIDESARYTVEFEVDSNTVNAVADCNNCSGRYTARGSTLQIRSLFCTLVGCLPPSYGEQFSSALSLARSFERSGDELLIVYPDGLLRFSRSR